MSTYCQKCGSELADGTRFCPACGFDTMGQGSSSSGSSSSSNQNQQFNSQPQEMGGTLTIIFVLGIIWGILSIIAGIFCVMGGALFGSIFPLGGAAYVVIGIICFIGGLLAILCCMNIYKREKYEQARLFLLIGSLIALITGGIIAGIIGIIFWFLMKDQKNRFKS